MTENVKWDRFRFLEEQVAVLACLGRDSRDSVRVCQSVRDEGEVRECRWFKTDVEDEIGHEVISAKGSFLSD